MFTKGVVTNRDAWTYNFSRSRLEENMSRTITTYNELVDAYSNAEGSEPESFLLKDASRISWVANLVKDLGARRRGRFDASEVQIGNYRPFVKAWVYKQRQWIWSPYRTEATFPPDFQNMGIAIVGPGGGSPFSVLMLDVLPNFHSMDTGQVFPRYYLADAGRDTREGLFPASNEDRKIDAITDWALVDFRKSFGTDVTKEEIFFYTYGILHSPDYRAQFDADLRKMLPRIPKVKDFRAFSDAGRKLSELHLSYDTVEPYPLDEQCSVSASYRVEKMKYAKTGRIADKSTVIYNSGITVSGIPEEAHEYMLGSRSAIDWIIERYQVKTDKASGIANDPNDWAEEQGNPRYILDLLARIVTVSVETVKIVNALPPLELIDQS
jgi:predicted helicase